jgi:SAM-dependent methyltransferase
VIETAMISADRRDASVPDNYRKGARPTWHQRRRHRAVLSLLAPLPGRVLDYGCGYGDLTWAMSRTHAACGVDLDPARVAFAQSEYAPLEFRVCEADDAPYPDESFDVIASVVVLNFIADAAAHLRSVRRMLRPAGRLILAYQNLFVVRNWVRRLVGRGPVPSELWMRSRGEVLGLVQSGGFQVVGESHFYDPPSDAWRRPGDLLVGSILQICSLLQVRATADYLILVAEKTDSFPSEPK